jgi:PleD family two-component response regulator
MPVLDGYGLLNILRSDSELRSIPVIVLTSEKGAEVKSLQLGAADFISKPYEAPEVIQARVKHSIELF